MPRFVNAVIIIILSFVGVCSSQQNTITSPERPGVQPPGPVLGGDGRANYIPIWRTSSYLLSSSIYQSPSGGNIGIGTDSPQAALDVNGNINSATNYEIGGTPILSNGNGADHNVFLGVGAGFSNIQGQGTQNIFAGFNAGNQNTTGIENAFSGYSAGASNTTGTANAFYGWEAGSGNTTGVSNTFIGWGAGSNNGGAGGNTFVGNSSGYYNTAGNMNTFLGTSSGFNNRGGTDNTFVGNGAGLSNTNGNGNSFFGYTAGMNNATGSSDLYLVNAGSQSGTESNTIRIGTDGSGFGQQNATYIAGIFSSTVSGLPVYITPSGQLGIQSSSLSFKDQVQDMGDSTIGLMKLRPVTFVYKSEYANGDSTTQYGLIAEEAAKVYPELVVYDDGGKPYSVRYQYVSTMLLNEVQKQYHRAEAEATVIQSQEQKIDELEQRLSRLEKLVGDQTVARK